MSVEQIRFADADWPVSCQLSFLKGLLSFQCCKHSKHSDVARLVAMCTAGSNAARQGAQVHSKCGKNSVNDRCTPSDVDVKIVILN